jgi:ketosteroid isomerase-like protein
VPDPRRQVVERLYDEWVRGDFSSREPFADDLDFEIDAAIVPDPLRVRGVDGMTNAWRAQIQAFDGFRSGAIEELIEVGDQIVVVNRVGGRGRQSQIDVDAPRAAVFTFRGSKIARLLLTNRDTAMATVGLTQ